MRHLKENRDPLGKRLISNLKWFWFMHSYTIVARRKLWKLKDNIESLKLNNGRYCKSIDELNKRFDDLAKYFGKKYEKEYIIHTKEGQPDKRYFVNRIKGYKGYVQFDCEEPDGKWCMFWLPIEEVYEGKRLQIITKEEFYK